MTKDTIISYLRENKTLFREKYGIVNIGLFGSYARGNATKESDIDILIEMQKDVENIHEKKEALKTMLEDAFGKKVEIARKKYLRALAKDAIIRDLCSA